MKTLEHIQEPKVDQPILQNKVDVPEKIPSLKDNSKDVTPSEVIINSNINTSSEVMEAGPSHPQEPDPREEKMRKLNLRTEVWSVREFLDLVKYSRDITLSLCYVLASPIDLQFPEVRRFGPTVEPVFKDSVDIINIWRFTKSTTCILVGANLCNTLIELFNLFKKYGSPTTEDLLWITVRSIDRPMGGQKPLTGVLDPGFLQKTDREILKVLEEVESANLDKTLHFLYNSLHGYYNLSVRTSHQSVNKLMILRLMGDPVKEGRSVADCFNTASSTRYKQCWEQMLKYMSLEGEDKTLTEKEIKALLSGWNISPLKYKGMYECEGRVTDRFEDHNYPSPADLRHLMGAGMPEQMFLIHQELFREEVRENIKMVTNMMTENQTLLKELMAKVDDVKIQLSQMPDNKVVAPLLPREDPNEGTSAVVRPSRATRTLRAPRGSRSNSSRASRPLSPVNPTNGIITSVGPVSTSHPDIFNLFQTSQVDTNTEVPAETDITIDPFRSDEDED